MKFICNIDMHFEQHIGAYSYALFCSIQVSLYLAACTCWTSAVLQEDRV